MRKRLHDQDEGSLSFWQVVQSVAAGFFGVQSAENRSRDFTHGKVGHFAIVGLLMTLLLIGVIWGAVELALLYAG